MKTICDSLGKLPTLHPKPGHLLLTSSSPRPHFHSFLTFFFAFPPQVDSKYFITLHSSPLFLLPPAPHSFQIPTCPCLSLPSGPLLLCLPVPPRLSVSPSLWSLDSCAPCTSPSALCLHLSVFLLPSLALDLYSQLLTLGPPPPLFPRSSEAEQNWDEGWRGREGKSQWGEEGQPDRLGSLGIFVRAPPSTTQPAHL